MASKEVLKHGTDVVPVINDNASSEFEAYETYSRKKIDEKLASQSGGSSDTSASFGYDWTGKNVVFEGESITMNTTMGYPEYVA